MEIIWQNILKINLILSLPVLSCFYRRPFYNRNSPQTKKVGKSSFLQGISKLFCNFGVSSAEWEKTHWKLLVLLDTWEKGYWITPPEADPGLEGRGL